MAVGDQQDFVNRIKVLLPNGWFRSPTPILDGVLNGIAWGLALAYSLAGYARLQTRIATATDGFLDLISFDFFGANLPRKSQEQDATFRARIQAEMLLERGTRHGLIRALQILTGRTPWVFEPGRVTDTGAYGTNTMGYGVAGGYGSLRLPFQAFCIAYRTPGQNIPYVGGYGSSAGGYGVGSQLEYVNPSIVTGVVTDADIYSAIDSVKDAGTIIWTSISN